MNDEAAAWLWKPAVLGAASPSRSTFTSAPPVSESIRGRPTPSARAPTVMFVPALRSGRTWHRGSAPLPGTAEHSPADSQPFGDRSVVPFAVSTP